jgi:hypothetical protein
VLALVPRGARRGRDPVGAGHRRRRRRGRRRAARARRSRRRGRVRLRGRDRGGDRRLHRCRSLRDPARRRGPVPVARDAGPRARLSAAGRHAASAVGAATGHRGDRRSFRLRLTCWCCWRCGWQAPPPSRRCARRAS